MPIKLKCIDCNVQWNYNTAKNKEADELLKKCVCGAYGFEIKKHKTISEIFLEKEFEDICLDINSD